MSGLNKVTLIGNLGKDPEITVSGSGMAIAKFSIATSDGMKDKTGNVKTEWHKIVAFKGSAEYISKYIKKGATVCIEGRIQYGKYENKEGVTVYTTDIICSNFINLTKKDESSQGSCQKPQQHTPQQFNIESDLKSDDLPF